MASVRVRDEDRAALVEERRKLRQAVRRKLALRNREPGASDLAVQKGRDMARADNVRVRAINVELGETDDPDDTEV